MEIPTECPDCHGELYDNRQTKKGNQPDFRCKDRKGCGKSIWLDKKQKSGGGGGGGGGGKRGPRMPLERLYKNCLVIAAGAINEQAKNNMIPVPTSSDYIAAAATLFIEACKSGTPLRGKAPGEEQPPPPPKKPEPKPQPQEEEFPGALADEDDDLPF